MEFRRGNKNMERAGAGVKRSLTFLRNVLSEKDAPVSVAAARECSRDLKSKLELLDAAKKDASSSKTDAALEKSSKLWRLVLVNAYYDVYYMMFT